MNFNSTTPLALVKEYSKHTGWFSSCISEYMLASAFFSPLFISGWWLIWTIPKHFRSIWTGKMVNVSSTLARSTKEQISNYVGGRSKSFPEQICNINCVLEGFTHYKSGRKVETHTFGDKVKLRGASDFMSQLPISHQNHGIQDLRWYDIIMSF